MLAKNASTKYPSTYSAISNYLLSLLYIVAWAISYAIAWTLTKTFPKTSGVILSGSKFPSGLPPPAFANVTIASDAVEVIVAFILAMIATLIGVNLIGPVATAVGGALNNKNLTGAANSLTGQITLIFVTVVIIGVIIFLALLGHKAASEA